MDETASTRGVRRHRLGDEFRRRLRLRLHLAKRSLTRDGFRNSETALVGLSAVIGIAVGLGVVVLRLAVSELHHLIFGIPLDGHLSDGFQYDWQAIIAATVLGGLLTGGIAWLIRRWRPRDPVDAIEANALHGGRMSLTDSLNIVLLTVCSVGGGASVGLEAAYTQLGAGYASRIGRMLKVRRKDLRTLVGCGAAAAIAAAYNAPMAGAFYAFELVLSSYTTSVLAPVAVAALSGAFAARATFGADPVFVISAPIQIHDHDYGLFTLLGVVAAGLSILTMMGVTAVEGWFRARALPTWIRPAVGGLLVGVIALAYPEVMGSGHGGILSSLNASYDLPLLLGLIAAKMAASAVSIGSGFRGGLFSSSLFLGSVLGSTAALVINIFASATVVDPVAFALVGMGAVAAGIIGAPVTMILLVLETTGDFAASVGVMVGVITSSLMVRHAFGYSFATWRFHLRGMRIQDSHDVGWIDDFTVARVMQRKPPAVRDTLPLAEFRATFPLGGAKYVVAVDAEGGCVGVVDLAEAHTADRDGEALLVADVLMPTPQVLRAGDSVRSSLELFIQTETEVLPVVDTVDRHRVVGLLSEAYALRRYNQELERRRSEELGESNLFSPSSIP
ncbi:MAG TPA: chloride channel protein [Stellaceae bacterium]|nr:chloride channel protein [Stellaceae bacterium]